MAAIVAKQPKLVILLVTETDEMSGFLEGLTVKAVTAFTRD